LARDKSSVAEVTNLLGREKTGGVYAVREKGRRENNIRKLNTWGEIRQIVLLLKHRGLRLLKKMGENNSFWGGGSVLMGSGGSMGGTERVSSAMASTQAKYDGIWFFNSDSTPVRKRGGGKGGHLVSGGKRQKQKTNQTKRCEGLEGA